MNKYPRILRMVVASLLSGAAVTSCFAQPEHRIEVIAGIAPVAGGDERASEFRPDRIPFATTAPDGSVVFVTTNPVQIWRLRDGVVHLVAGGGRTFIAEGIPASEVDLGLEVNGVSADALGNIYFIHHGGALFSVGSDGFIHYAGLPFVGCTAMGRDGTLFAVAAFLADVPGLYRRPPGQQWSHVPGTEDITYCNGMAVDGAGNAIVAVPFSVTLGLDSALWRIGPQGERTPVAGNPGVREYSGDGGPASEAGVFAPRFPVVDAAGNIYFTDRVREVTPDEGRLRRVTLDGTIERLPGCQNCIPVGVDAEGNLLVHLQWGEKRAAAGNLYGYGEDGSLTPVLGPAAGDGTALGTRLSPQDIALDGAGNLWVASLDRVVKIDVAGMATVFHGGADGAVDANGLPAPGGSFWAQRIAVDPDGNVFVAGFLPPPETPEVPTALSAIWKLSPEGEFAAVLVPASRAGSANHGVAAADVESIVDLAATGGSVYYIPAKTDGDAHLFQVDPDGNVVPAPSYVRGPLAVDDSGSLRTGPVQLNGDFKDFKVTGFWEGEFFGDITHFDFAPEGLFVERGSQELGFLALNAPYRRIAASTADLVAENHAFGGDGGASEAAKLGLGAVASAPDGTNYVADPVFNVIWKITDEVRYQPMFSSDSIVNSASSRPRQYAPDTWITIYGTFLLPLPGETGDVPLTVTITDSEGVAREAEVDYSSPAQLNVLIPAETATGPAEVFFQNQTGRSWTQTIEIVEVAPGLFSYPAEEGVGIAAGFAVRVKSDGTQETIPLVEVGVVPQPGTFRAKPIPLGGEDEPLYLTLFGTGFAHPGSLENVSATIDGVDVPETYAGPQREFDGLQQVNLGPVPSSVLRDGPLEYIQIHVDGKSSNWVVFDVY